MTEELTPGDILYYMTGDKEAIGKVRQMQQSPDYDYYAAFVWLKQHSREDDPIYDAIKSALIIANRLQKEPSDEVISRMRGAYTSMTFSEENPWPIVFKAMRDQLIKEMEDD